MAGAQGPVLAAVLLLVSAGVHCSSPPPVCPESCTCQRAALLNCSSSGLSLVPQDIPDSVTELDLSHNLLDSATLHRPHRNLRNVWLGNNSITHLSLCVDRSMGSQSVSGGHLHRLRPWSRRRCVSWAPTLQLLSVERNQLMQLPEGLERSPSLWVLQLSFNRISTVRPGDLSHLRQLKELHLQHNLITSLHPQMFQDLTQLRVLDLSFNMLTSLHPLMYLSLHNIGADVGLGGNRWQCDCSMRSLRRRMAFDSSRGLQAWDVVCASPSILSGKDLLQLEEDDLNCFGPENRPEIHQDVTVYSGSEIMLSCSTQDPMWWTPSGQASVNQPQADLLISDVTERDTGLYVCMSEDHEVVSVFNLQISRVGGARRKTRSLPRTIRQVIPQDTPSRIGEERNQRATQSQLVLAVCLSVFITFLIAFILGVLARPCIDVLWAKVTKKKSPASTNSVSSVQQRQYENEAYSDGEEPEEVVTHRERRVTFSTIDYREHGNVQYYDTVASGNQESINKDAVIECESAKTEEEKHTDGDSGSENSLPQDTQRDGRAVSGITDAGRTHKMEFEHIPDPVELEERRSLSSCSDSSLSDKALKDHTTPKSPQLAEDSIQQRADFSTSRKVEVPQISIEDESEIPGFSSEPFADWSPHTNNANPKDSDLWQENEEQFEFSDSVRSTSARSSSVFDSFTDSKLIVVPNSDRQNRVDTSSSSSYISEDEPTQYTLNSDQEEEQDVIRYQDKSEVTDTFDPQRPAERPEYPSSSHSSDSDGASMQYTVNQEEEKGEANGKSIAEYDQLSSRIVTGEGGTREKVKPMPRTKWRGLSLGVTSFGKSLDTSAPSPPKAYSSSSSSESEAEITDLKVKQTKGRVDQINAPLPASDSSSSDETTDETTKHTKTQEQGEVDMTRLPFQDSQTGSHDSGTQWPVHDPEHTTHAKSRLDIKAPSRDSDSSSSSDSEDETTHLSERTGKVGDTELLLQKSQTVSHDPDGRWPALDLEHIPSIKRRLDIKATHPPLDSASTSKKVEETIARIKKHKQGEIHMARRPNKVSQTVSHDTGTQWPLLDLEHTTRIKRRLDIKAASPDSDSSSSGGSEDETTQDIKKERPGVVEFAGLPYQESQKLRNDPETQWPALNLEHIPHINRRLDIKSRSPDSDSSSSSGSEDKTTQLAERPGKVGNTELPLQKSQTVSHDPDGGWPALDLEHIPSIKRRLDIKAKSPDSDSSSSSDSEDETTNHIKKQEQGEIHMARLPNTVSQPLSHDPGTQWPLLDLEHTTRVKRRLDIKATSPDSSSRSDSDDETSESIANQRPAKVDTVELQKSQTLSHDQDGGWPALDLQHIPSIKRRLDIKSRSPDSDSSSSGGREDETTQDIKKERPGVVEFAGLPYQESQKLRNDPETQWPALNLEHIPHINRRLDIKSRSPDSDSSSSSGSEDKTTQLAERPGKVGNTELPLQKSQTVSHDPDGGWPALDLEHIPSIKRRLDIKAKSPDSDSSSSSDSEDETTNHIKKQEQGEIHMARLPNTVSQPVSHDPGTQWPLLDLEHTTHVKRRLDIKATSPDSSSRSDSDDETSESIANQRPAKVDTVELQKSQTLSHDQDGGWPALDLQHIPSIKRRLDIKSRSPDSDSSSSSDSEDEITNHIKKHEQGEIHMARLPNTVSQPVSHEPGTQWPLLDLEHTTHIKRRLDIKATSPDSSSSSDSDHETAESTAKQRPAKVDTAELQKSQTVSHDPDIGWPALDLQHIPRIKRRLDIKSRSPDSDSSSSSDSEDETTNHIKKTEKREIHMARLPNTVSQPVSHDPGTQWPLLDLEHTTRVKRRLDIKARSSSHDSLSSGGRNHTKKGKTEETKISPRYSSSSSDEQEEYTDDLSNTSITGEPEPDPRWPQLDLSSAPHVKRRLDIKTYSPPTESSVGFQQTGSNSSGIKRENRDHTAKVGMGVSVISETSEKTPVINIPHNKKTDHNIKLDKYAVISDDLGDKQTNDNISTTPEINPELQSQWATMNLGISRFRKRLEITSHTHAPPTLPTSPPPHSHSSSSSENESGSKNSRTRLKRREDGMQEIICTDSSLTLENKPVNVSLTLKSQDNISSNLVEVKERLKKDYSLPTTEEKSNPDNLLTGFDSPQTLRYLDIRASEKAPAIPSSKQLPDSLSSSVNQGASTEYAGRAPLQRQSSSSSNSGDEIDHSVPDLSLGVPRIKRRLNFKAPSPEPNNPSSSSSESEREVTGYTAKQSRHASNLSGTTDNDQITYKRLIMKASLPLQRQTVDHVETVTVAQGLPRSGSDRNVHLAPKVPSITFDDIVKKSMGQSRNTTDVDVPPGIKWTGIGRHLSDFSTTSSRRRPGAALSSPQQDPPPEPELSSPDSFNISSTKSVSLTSNRALDKFDNSSGSMSEILRTVSEDKSERKGLSALKVMSSERRKWDTVHDKGASPLFDDHGPQGDTSRFEEGIKPLAKQPLTSSTSVHKRGAADLLYGIPRYRTHDIGDIEPPQEVPPPIPATPPPDEAVGLTWRSPQSIKSPGRDGIKSYLQHSRHAD
ncbi:leucine-rich repeat-containing protein 66 isoform X2 [Seriola lalandi dorsalis]|uniref:leucine-rich repeat-containing protein 66 isoform X2 n=1 Tax=Seriola lalandi dorsalis TaxID=1841481 RepID=UPI000C6FA3A7|nr:leucine-rich repeat-containing protein 66 isoform X2 [Seriola lalandi dorsalis]